MKLEVMYSFNYNFSVIFIIIPLDDIISICISKQHFIYDRHTLLLFKL